MGLDLAKIFGCILRLACGLVGPLYRPQLQQSKLCETARHPFAKTRLLAVNSEQDLTEGSTNSKLEQKVQTFRKCIP